MLIVEKRLEELTVEELIKVMLDLQKKVSKEGIKEYPITSEGVILLDSEEPSDRAFLEEF